MYATEAERQRARAESRRRENEKRRADPELHNYDRRVRYWQNHEEMRAKGNKRQREWRANPENKLNASERLSRRKAAAALRASRMEFAHAQNTFSRSLAEMENPSYVVIDAHGHRTLELWPIKDPAALWLAEHESGHQPELVSTKPLDTSPQQQ